MQKSVERLVKQFKPRHYKINLHVKRAERAFAGTVEIDGKLDQKSSTMRLHAKDLVILGAAVDGERAKVTYHEESSEVTLALKHTHKAGDCLVTISFEGKIADAMHGLYPCYFEHKGKQKELIATQFESHHAREVFPCVDEPEAKATFDLTLVTEDGNTTVLSNMPVKESSVISGKTATGKKQAAKGDLLQTTFETTPRMPTYLLAFVVGEMHKVSGATKDGVQVNVWSSPAQPTKSLEFALSTAVGAIEFFNDYFGTPYPLPKCDHVALPDFSAGAMENWGLVTYREVALLADPANTAQSTKEWVATVISHETSHQWFGNLVTMRWWDDLWLNESFATLMEYLAVDAMYPEWDIWTTFGNQEAFSAFRRDALPGVQAVKTEVRHPDEISTLFDSAIVYAKGARLLYMLYSYIGEKTFKKGLGQYFSDHAYDNTQGKDLWRALSDASGKDVAAFMEPWLTQPGYPVITVDHDGDQLDISQKQFLFDRQNKQADGKLWAVPLLPTQPLPDDLLKKRQAAFTLRSDQYIRLNDAGGSGHYIVRYKQDAHRQAIKDDIVAGNVPATESMFLLHDSSLLAKAGDGSVAETLDMLSAYTHSTSEPVWDTIAGIIGEVKRIVEPDETTEAAFKQFVAWLVAEQYQRLGWDQASDEPASDTKLRSIVIGLGVYAEVPDILQEAKRRYQKAAAPEKLPAELRPIIFTAAVRHGVKGAFEQLIQAHQDTANAELQQDICAGVTSTKDRRQIRQLTSRLTDSQFVRPQDVGRWFVYLLRNRWSREDAWQWMASHWQWIEEQFGQDKSYDHYPRFGAMVLSTDEWLQRYQAFFEPLKDRPALKRTIAVGLTDIAARAAWCKRDLPHVQDFLRQWQAQTTGKNSETTMPSPASSTAAKR